MSKTVASQMEKATNSYYYWHNSVPSGEAAAPVAKPLLLATETQEATKEAKTRSITTYSLLDDGGVVKVYVSLDGDLEDVTCDGIEAEFASRSMSVTLSAPQTLHVLHIAQLANEIVPGRCKVRVTKSRKVVISLEKKLASRTWTALRAR